MNKAQLVEAVADRTGSTKKSALDAVEAVLDEIIAQVADGKTVVLTGFGTFSPALRAARTARNPQTGDAVDVPETTVPRFKAGAVFKNAVKS